MQPTKGTEAPAPAEFWVEASSETEARGEGQVGGRGLTVRQPSEVDIFLVPNETSKGARPKMERFFSTPRMECA